MYVCICLVRASLPAISCQQGKKERWPDSMLNLPVLMAREKQHVLGYRSSCFLASCHIRNSIFKIPILPALCYLYVSSVQFHFYLGIPIL